MYCDGTFLVWYTWGKWRFDEPILKRNYNLDCYMFTKTVHVMGSKVMKIQIHVHTTQDLWQTDISHFTPFLFFWSLQTLLVCSQQYRSVKSICDTWVPLGYSSVPPVTVWSWQWSQKPYSPECQPQTMVAVLVFFVFQMLSWHWWIRREIEVHTHNLTRNQTPNLLTHSPISVMSFY